MLDKNRRRRGHRQRLLLNAIAGAVVVWAGIHFALPVFSVATGRAGKVASDRRDASVSHPAPPSPQHPARPVYPYSIIRGGAYNAAELARALDLDAVAAGHYAVFQRTLAHTAESPFSAPVFLSYRVGDAIYWTSRPVRLPRGETVLTDGKNYARARCGNRISQTPLTPVSDTEPASSEMDQPKPSADFLRADNLDTWSENRLVTELSPPFALLVPAHLPATAAAVPDHGAAPQAGAAPSWWGISAPAGFLPIWDLVGRLGPNLPPPSSGGTGGPVIQPNPVPGLPFPPLPGYGYSPTGSTTEAPLTFTTATITPGSPPTTAAVPPFFLEPPLWLLTPSAASGELLTFGVPSGTPGASVPIDGPALPDLPNVPSDQIPQTPEPVLLLPTVLALAAMIAVGYRRARTMTARLGAMGKPLADARGSV
jgi:hypothetical protein